MLALAGCVGVSAEAAGAERAPATAKPPAQAAVPAPANVQAPPAAAPQPRMPAGATPEQAGDDYDVVLRQAMQAYERGEHQTALLFYERVLGRAPDPRDQLRALVSMAMLRLSPASKIADPAAAETVLREFERRVRDSGLEHEYVAEIELLRLLQTREKEMRSLRDANRKLKAQLAAKEELIRKLRALTVEGG